MRWLDRIQIQFISAEPEKILTKLAFGNVKLINTKFLDLLTVQICIQNRYLYDAERILNRCGTSWKIQDRKDIRTVAIAVIKRPVLLIGMILFFFLAGVLPQRILFVEITGNERIPAQFIVEQARNCGLGFCSEVSTVRSEEIKNRLLSEIPQLQWVGITTRGCIATIQVTERTSSVPSQLRNMTVSGIVASHDGVITEVTVRKGNPLCRIGESVNAGDLLVSGYTDCGLKVKAEQADAEIYAHTLRQNTFIALHPAKARGAYLSKSTCYGLRIGKKVINLWNHSGISEGTCVKMYSEDYWTLPGGFRLPVSIVKTECYYYAPVDPAEDTHWLPQAAKSYVTEQMIAGDILDNAFCWTDLPNGTMMEGKFACHEMIGQVKIEEIADQYAEDN